MPTDAQLQTISNLEKHGRVIFWPTTSKFEYHSFDRDWGLDMVGVIEEDGTLTTYTGKEE